MAASIAAVYPHMNHIGGDGFWLIREPSGRVRALMGAGRAGVEGDAAALPRRRIRRDPGARAARRAHRAGRRRRLDAGGGSRQGARRPTAARCPARRRHQACARGLYRHPQPGGAHAETSSPSSKTCPALPRPFSSTASRRKRARGSSKANSPTRSTISAQCRARRFLSRRCRPRDRRRSRAHRRAGDARRFRAVARERRRAAQPAQLPPARSITRRRRRRGSPRSSSSACSSGCASTQGGKLRARPRPRRSDQARLPRARPRRHRSRPHDDADLDRFLAAPFLDAEAAKDRPHARRRPGRRRAARATPSGWARRTLPVSSSPISSRSTGNSAPACVLPATGVLMQNRGASFSLDPKALNALAPGRRPFHTLNPALAALKDGRVIAYGTMGGDGQPQTQAAVFTRHVAFGQPLERALDAPRWLLGRTWGSTHTNLRLESRFDEKSDRPADGGRSRRRGSRRALLRHHGPRRRGRAACRRHARRRPRSARRRRRRGVVNFITLFV